MKRINRARPGAQNISWPSLLGKWFLFVGAMGMTQAMVVAAEAPVKKEEKVDSSGEASKKEDAKSQEVQAFVQKVADEGLALLEQNRGGDKEAFRPLFQKYFRVQLMGKKALGRKAWDSATPEEQKKYLSLFEDDMLATYVNLTRKHYKKEKLKVLRANEQGKGWKVMSEVISPSGKKLPINWLVKPYGSSFAISDVYLEGASIIRTKREHDYKPLLQKGGVKNLIQSLESKHPGGEK